MQTVFVRFPPNRKSCINPCFLLPLFSTSPPPPPPPPPPPRNTFIILLISILYFIFLAKSLQEPISQLTLDEDEAAGSENEDGEGVAATKELPEYACR